MNSKDLQKAVDDALKAVIDEMDRLLPPWRAVTLPQLLADFDSHQEPLPSRPSSNLPPPSGGAYARYVLAKTCVLGEGVGPDGYFEGEELALAKVVEQNERAQCIGFFLPNGKIGRVDNYDGRTTLLLYGMDGELNQTVEYKRGVLKLVKTYVRDATGRWLRTVQTDGSEFTSPERLPPVVREPAAPVAGESSPRANAPAASVPRAQDMKPQRRWWQFWK